MFKILKEIKNLFAYFSDENKYARKITFYSERSIYYQYYKPYIDYILENSDCSIAYVTSDENDQVFKLNNSRIKVFYAKTLLQLITGFTDASLLIYTMPDLGKYYIKRAQNLNVEHLYIFHAMMSTHMAYLENAFDNYDTIFSIGNFQTNEIRKTEEIYNLKPKNIIKEGYPYLKNVYDNKEKNVDDSFILVAPSWHKGNMFETCMNEVVSSVLECGYNVIVRPHPELLQRNPDVVYKVEKEFKNNPKFKMEKDLSDNSSIKKSALLITDWSGISFEYALATERPVLFVNTEMKVNNKEYLKLDMEPIEISIREKLGKSIEIVDILSIKDYIIDLMNNKKYYINNIVKYRDEFIYNWNNPAKIGGEYIINKIKENL